jgi:YfiH family protein
MSSVLHSKKYFDGELIVYDNKPAEKLIHCHQIHSNTVIEFKGDDLTEIKADGIIIDPGLYPNHLVAIKTADCLPVLLIGRKIALVHAGWKGLENNILSNEKIKILEISDIYIGPAIQTYEVQEEFRKNFPNSKNFLTSEGILFFNLQKEAMDQLKTTYPNAKIFCSDICTFKNNHYNSYRRDKTKIRNWNVFKIN